MGKGSKMENIELLRFLKIPDKLWPDYLRKEAGLEPKDPPKKAYFLEDAAKRLVTPQQDPVDVPLTAWKPIVDVKEPMARAVAVRHWFDNDAATRMPIGEYKEFWDSLKFEDKEYLSLMASEALNVALKSEAETDIKT